MIPVTVSVQVWPGVLYKVWSVMVAGARLSVLTKLPCTCATGPQGSLLCLHVLITVGCWLDGICYRR